MKREREEPICVAASRLFQVENEEAFREALSNVPVDIEATQVAGERYLYMYSDDGCWPQQGMLEDAEGNALPEDQDLLDLVHPHLKPGTACLIEQVVVTSRRIDYQSDAIAYNGERQGIATNHDWARSTIKHDFHAPIENTFVPPDLYADEDAEGMDPTDAPL